MEDSGLDGAGAQARAARCGPLRSEWKPLLLAAVASLAAHGLLLAALRIAPQEQALVPRFVVRLAAAPAAPAAAEPAPSQPALPQAVAAAPRPARPASAVAVARPQAAPPRPARPPAFHTADSWSFAPRARSAPDTGEAGAALKARRLAVTVWIEATGRVQRAEVTRNEVDPELARQLEEAVLGVRFLPAQRDGQAVGAEYRTLLCFDDAGKLDTASEECWQVDRTGTQ